MSDELDLSKGRNCQHCGEHIECGIFHSIAHMDNCEAAKSFIKPYNEQDIKDILNGMKHKAIEYELLENMTQPMREEFDRIMKDQFKHKPKIYKP